MMTYLNRLATQSPELFGIILRIVSTVCFALMSGAIKHLDKGIALGEVVFFRSSVALVPLLVFLIMTSHFPSALKTQRPWRHVTRCFTGTIAMFFAFGSLRLLPIAEATAISYLSPVFIVVFAAFWLLETINARRLLGVGFGVLGLLVMTLPSFSGQLDTQMLMGIALGIIAAMLIALSLLQVRQLSKMGENPGTIAFYFALTSTLMSAITIIGGWEMPTASQWVALIAIGLLGGVAQIFMTVAYQYAEASAMAPYEYLSIVWAVMIGLLAFGELPDVVFWVAMPLILLGGFVAKPRPQQKK